MIISKIFSDNMILQREKAGILTGEAKPFEKMTVCIGGKTVSGQAGADGTFALSLPVFEAGGPYTMEISGEDEAQKQVFSGVLFGDVFLLGGQSNMELSIGMIPDQNNEELTSAYNPDIRMFQVAKEYDFSGKTRMLSSGEWLEVNTSTIEDFSALGYYFAREKYEKDHVPVGLVHIAVGGTPIEALMSEENLLTQAEKIRTSHRIAGSCDGNKNMGCIFCYEKLLEKVKQPGYTEKVVQDDLQRVNKWHEELAAKDPGLLQGWMKEKWEETGEIETIQLPRFFLGTKYESYIGSLWLQKTVCIPKQWMNKEVLLSLGTLVDFDKTYVNGKLVGETGYKYPPRRYKIGKDILRAGENTITIRLGMDANIGGAIPDMPYCLVCEEETIDLTGEWRIRRGAGAKKLEGETFFIWNPTAQYHSMIAPLKGVAFDAVLFYQGESNCGHPEYYGELFTAMVEEWRGLFGKDIPFFVAELAYYLGDGPEYISDPFAGVRDVQRCVVPKLGNAYLVPICELGQYNELHPQNKKEVGHLFFEVYDKNRKGDNV